MLHFDSDYMEGMHPQILEAFVATNMEQTTGYGLDEYCVKAREAVRKACDAPEADVHFLVGGTQTNSTVIRALLRPHEGVLAAATGHIAVHESGAIEAGGHKVITLPHNCGKITAAQVDDYMSWFYADESFEHMVFPGMVYISHPTEGGTLYSRQELAALHDACKELGLYLFLDGARLAYGLAAEPDLTLPDIAAMCDVFYIGGTKQGALFGEAVVICNESLKKDFRYHIKQNGGMLAKGRLLGLQFETLFTDDLYFKIAAHANVQALRIKEAFAAKGFEFLMDSPTNQQFPIVTEGQAAILGKDFGYTFWKRIDSERVAIRFCTSWATKTENVDKLVDFIATL